ncbi:anti-sigma B factor RsbW [Cohnella cholangitidis]|uniref:Anti-sigma B factor RsbW n=1 Tax=Cohnella cholangitidis TaxID=2598458 RepID=A0A7G5BVT9_9BACL|nr:anti-sigma B factor RsbW [Cohnella cholangitidis]QMV41073.1 anti-sigma B factor RsbW [Cohnella cholangitidis]
MAKESNVTLTVPALPEYVDLVRLTLYGVASKMKFTFEDIEDMKVAVSEACNNAVLHAYGGAEGKIEVSFASSDEELSITVRDYGKSFTIVDSKEPASLHGKSINEIQSGGLGLYLMQALMDRVDVQNDDGTSVTLMKKRMKSEETA